MKKLPVLFFALFIAGNMLAQNHKFSRVRISASDAQVQGLLASGIPIDDGIIKKGAFIIAELSGNNLKQLKEKGIHYEVLIDDVQSYYLERNKNASYKIQRGTDDTYPVPDGWELGSMGGMYTLSQIQAELDSMRTQYPDLISSVQQIGDHVSIEGRPMQWVRISDNPDQNEEEPEVLYTALHHAREGIGVQQMIYYMYYLLENYDTDDEVRNIVDNTELYFIPVLNPDGYFYNEDTYPGGGGMWRKNRRDNEDGYFGVDLNRNYGYMWGYDNNGSSPVTSDETYRGESPFSEPETQAVREFCNEHEFVIALNYHSYSNLLLSPWGYTQEPCPDHDVFIAYGEILTTENGYTYGPGSTTIYPTNGGSDDWMYGEQETKPLILSYTPEVGSSDDGFWPAIDRIVPLCQENMYQNIMAARLAGKYANAEDQAPFALSDTEGYLQFSLKRLGQTNASFTVSIEPLNDAIAETGEAKTFEEMEVLEVREDSISYTLNSNLQPGDEIKYLLKVSNGEITNTDTISKYYGTPQIVFEDDGNNFDNWSGDWALTTNNYHSPTGSITDSPFGDYSSYDDKVIVLDEPVDLSGAVVANLSFYAIWEIEKGWDYVQVEISTNDGMSWEPLAGRYTITGNENQAFNEPVYDGFQTEWVREEIDLSAYAEEDIRIRFRLVSDSWVNEDGYYFDDLEISIISQTTGVDDAAVSGLSITGPRPNPAKDRITFGFEASVGQSLHEELAIYNSQGLLIGKFPIDANSTELQINVSEWKSGIYFYRLSNTENARGKFIVF